MKPDIEKLSRDINYQFRDPDLLRKALTHSSAGKNNNERFEFLGDSILGWVIAEAIFQRFPRAKEGEMSRLRASLVKGVTLAKIAREFQLGDYLKLGQGEMKSGGHRRDSILADAMEALIGAIYLDSNSETCKQQVLFWFEERLSNLSIDDNQKDAKTLLQEYLQARKQPLPSYQVQATHGKEHQQVFEVICEVPLLDQPLVGTGNSKRQAEQHAARQAIIAIKHDAQAKKTN